MNEDGTNRLIDVARVARHKWRAISAIVIGSALLGAVVASVLPPRYTAQASFFPESRTASDLTSGLGGLAGLVGAVGGPLGLGQSSSQFFADLFKSGSFLDTLAGSPFKTDTIWRFKTLEEYLVPRAHDAADRRWRARKHLRRAIRVSTLPSGVVVVAVTDRSAYVAAAMANRSIEIIDELNIDFRRRQASARRRFTQQFLQDVQQRLTDAEDRLERFLETNRTFVTPALLRKQQALQVEVDRLRVLKQQLETNIDNARLTEYNDAPVVATVDAAPVPERPSGPLRLVIFTGVVLASLAGTFWALYLKLWR